MQAKAREGVADADNWVGGGFWSADKGWPPWIAPLLDLRFLATQPFDEQICIWERVQIKLVGGRKGGQPPWILPP